MNEMTNPRIPEFMASDKLQQWQKDTIRHSWTPTFVICSPEGGPVNPQSFGLIGYISILLWLGMIGLMVLQEVKKPRRWFCHIALIVGLVALVCAKVNSHSHVNRLEIDRSEQIAEQQARQEAARKAAIEARGDEVSQVRVCRRWSG